MPARDLALLTEAAREAGRIALRFWRREHKVWDKGGEHGPVTEADLAVNDMLKARLLAARPGYGWLSEETPDSAERLAVDTVFIVDPIDGTRAFVAGEESFAHSLAVAHQGRVTAAVVYLPALDRIYTASETASPMKDGQPIMASERERLEGAGQSGDESAERWRDLGQVLLKELARFVVAPYLLCLGCILREPVAQLGDALRDAGQVVTDASHIRSSVRARWAARIAPRPQLLSPEYRGEGSQDSEGR